MSKWTEPIYDRTLLDVQTRTAKGLMNIADWVRIVGNTEQIQALERIVASVEVELNPAIVPTITHFPTVEELNDLAENIDRLIDPAAMPASLGLTHVQHDYIAGNGADAPDYETVNQWEEDLALLQSLLKSAGDYTINCGVAAVGQQRFYQWSWRVWPYFLPAASPVRSPRCGFTDSGAGLMRQNSWRQYS